MEGVDELTVGRAPDNELVIEDSSASKRHAMLRWDAANNRCTLQFGSTNGTFLNASVHIRRDDAEERRHLELRRGAVLVPADRHALREAAWRRLARGSEWRA